MLENLVPPPRPAARLFAFFLGFFFLACVGEGRAWALDPDPGVIVVVHSDSPELHPEAMRAAVAKELGMPAMAREDAAGRPVLGTVTVTWRPSRSELAVTYEETGRGALSRIVPAPPDVEKTITTATMLTANLVRREADELLPPLASEAPRTTTVPPAVEAPADKKEAYLPVNASLFYPLATNFGKRNVTTHLDVNLLYGRVGRVDGAQLGLFNHAGGDLNGAQIAFGMNLVHGATEGFQIATAMNLTGGSVEGLQASFAFNRAGGHVSGIQGSMGINVADGGLEGIAFGAANFAGDVRGLQLGLLNVGGTVKGVQLGLVNVADDVEGVPIGLVSVTKTGGIHPLAWGSNTSLANVGVKFATRYTYTMVSGAAHPDGSAWLYGPGFTVGAHVPIARFYFETDIGLTWLFNGTIHEKDAMAGDIALTKLRVVGGYTILDHLSAFAGVGTALRTRFGTDRDAPSMRLVPELFAGIQF